jgi:hypothetical protein
MIIYIPLQKKGGLAKPIVIYDQIYLKIGGGAKPIVIYNHICLSKKGRGGMIFF